MTILIGLLLWLGAGTSGALLARLARPSTAGSQAFTVAWGIFGGFIGGLIGVLPYLPREGQPWQPGAMVAALLGGFALSLLYRLARRSGASARGGARAAGLLLLGLGSIVLAVGAWFLLAVANYRLYQPKYNPAVEGVLARACRPGAPLARTCMTQLVRVYLSRPENAGIVIGAWVDGARVRVSGGVASRADGTAMDVNSLFEVGSITKVFTGLALARAVTSGQLRLNEPVVDLLPKDPLLAGVKAVPIDLEDLATHYAGLPDGPPPWWSGVLFDNPYARLSEHDLLDAFARSAQRLPARRSFAYSNFGYTLLGYALERAAGVPFPRLLEQRVFQPLGMTRTFAVSDTAVPLGLVDGYSLGQRMPHWIGQRFAGAVGVVSCVDDLLTLIDSEVRLRPDSLRDALRLAETARRKAEGDHWTALGWAIRVNGSGHRFVHHSGHTPGFYSYVGYAPDARVGVVVLGNSSDPSAQAIGSRLLDVLASQPPTRTATTEFVIGGSPRQ